jgi:hypothetical protein
VSETIISVVDLISILGLGDVLPVDGHKIHLHQHRPLLV